MVDPERLFVHLPYELLEEYRPLIFRAGLAVELLVEARYLEVATLEALAEEVRALKAPSGRVAIHAPYEGIDPGHPAESEREEVLRLLTLTCALAQAAGASFVVVHTGYEPDRVAADPVGWHARSQETWKALLDQPASIGVTVALEHTLEPEPSVLRSIVDPLPAQQVGVCLDTGHLNCFASAPSAEWWTALGERVAVLHLHDNDGQEDDHKGIGEGTFDFGALFRWLKRTNVRPFATIEGKDPAAVVTSLAAMGFPVDPGLLESLDFS